MDMIAGASELDRRIAGHAHWRQARAVLDGRQRPSDPDADQLVEMGDGLRLYRPEVALDGSWPVLQQRQKRLVNGRWCESIVTVGAENRPLQSS